MYKNARPIQSLLSLRSVLHFPIAFYSVPTKIAGYEPDTKIKPIHMYHVENFFNAVMGKAKLNCDAEHAFAAEAAVFKARDAIEKGPLEFSESDFIVS